MIHFNIFESEPRYLFLTHDEDKDRPVLTHLEDHINLVPPECYLPQYRGIPYREEFLFKRLNSSGKLIYYCAVGLWQEIYKYFKANNIQFDGLEPTCLKKTTCTLDEFKAIVDSWGLKFNPRPYQYEAAWKVLQWKQSLSQLCTRAGKTLIAYMIFRYLMEREGVKKILMIVPSVSLVKQGFDDFKEYAEFFQTECIWAGGKEVDSANLTIGTFQSLIKYLDKNDSKYNPAFFNQFDAVFVDEVHRAKSSQVKRIITQPFFYRCKLVYGMTGTLPKEKTIDRYTLAALLGAKIQDITAAELIEENYISPIKIHQLYIQYPKGDKLNDLYTKAGEYLLSDYEIKPGTKTGKIPLDDPHFLYKYKKTLPPGVIMTRERLHDNNAYLDYLKDLIKESDSTNNLLLERMVLHDLPYRMQILSDLIWDRIHDKGNWLILTHHQEYTDAVFEYLQKKVGEYKKIFLIRGSVSVKKRSQIIQDMKEGNAILVASYGCMSTGMTLPDLRYGVLFESFKSNIVNEQSLGRGLGKSEGKEEYEVWDFVDVLPTGKIKKQGKEREKIYKERKFPYTVSKIKGLI